MIIPYQYRYRGPYEYDKHVLNAMQLHNAVANITKDISDGGNNSLQILSDEIDEQLLSAAERNQEIIINWLSAE